MPNFEQPVFVALKDTDADQYAGLTFPAYRPLLSNVRANVVIAVGAQLGKEPIGLALGHLTEDPASGVLLSVAVQRSHRGRGIGTRLVTELEEMSRSRGAAKLSLTYMSGNSSVRSLEKLLQRRDWTTPKPRMLFCRGHIQKVMRSEFLRIASPARGLAMTLFNGVGEEDKREIMDRAELRFPHLLKSMDRPVQLETSLAVYRAGRLAGWIVTHRISEDTLRYSRVYVSDRQRHTGAGFFLIAEAIRRQSALARSQGQPQNIVFDTELDNQAMINFIRRRLNQCVDSSSVTLGSFKLLSSPAMNLEI
jgi:GNAT superfamily N-acetyltransferase